MRSEEVKMPVISTRSMRGIRVSLPGTTVRDRPYLHGEVIEDEARSFSTAGSGYPVVSGVLQDRVARIEDGRLSFEYHLRELTTERPGTAGIDQGILVEWVPQPTEAEVDFRWDSVGEIAPQNVLVNGDAFYFEYSSAEAITPTALSRFIYILPTNPRVTEYRIGGVVIITTSSWYVRIPDCFMPIYPAMTGAGNSSAELF
jgi:hypothetical protein